MKTLYFTLENQLRVMVIPDTMAHLDGHTIITHTYSVFRDIGAGNPLIARSKENALHLEEIKDPDYYGFITLNRPGSHFNYSAGQNELYPHQVEELITHLNNLRENPALWNEPNR